MNDFACRACSDTGWIHFQRTIKGRRYPWSAACLCDKGRYLSAPRPHHPKSLPRKDDQSSLPPPVVVVPVDRELFYERGGVHEPNPRGMTSYG